MNEEQRKRYTTMAKKYNLPIRCYYFEVPKEICMHNNAMRK